MCEATRTKYILGDYYRHQCKIMSITNSNMKIETLAWVTDDEAEFWTSTSPREKTHQSHNSLTSKDLSSNIFSSNGLYFKTNNQLDTEMEDHLSLLSKQAIEKQKKEEKNKVEEKHIFDIFQLNNNIHLKENNSEEKMGFFSRLYHQLTRSSPSEIDYLDDDVFIDIDENEITAVVNNNTDMNTSFNVESKFIDNIPFVNNFKSFIDELTEEKDVIMGNIDEEILFNRRSQKAKSSLVPIKTNETFYIQTSF
ncbi:unnamed protein product [Rotaria sp. Silwood2]|nr:unnamed protein product [Rotaria sp. Silwood2]CAF3289580.1 unnamed protein product [Rotaria sp. Silwood2]CAF4098510.1 unnamed protein product [Rotaria sp. Silwood2]CAF4328972.1 unnamed protein product [Rotaria sp. Silwood2]